MWHTGFRAKSKPSPEVRSSVQLQVTKQLLLTQNTSRQRGDCSFLQDPVPAQAGMWPQVPVCAGAEHPHPGVPDTEPGPGVLHHIWIQGCAAKMMTEAWISSLKLWEGKSNQARPSSSGQGVLRTPILHRPLFSLAQLMLQRPRPESSPWPALHSSDLQD